MDNERRELLADENRIEPITVIHDILVNWWVILLGAICAAMLAFMFVEARYVPKYTTSATFVVTSKSGSYSYGNLAAANSMAKAFQQILKSNVMEKKIKEALQADELDAEITSRVAEGTNLLTLSVTSSSPEKSIDIIRTVMENYDDVSLYVIANGVMNVLEEPTIPVYPDNPLNAEASAKKLFYLALFGMTALFGFLSYNSNTVKSEKEIEEKLDAKSLGIISYEFKYKTLKELFSREKKALLVTSPIAGFKFVEEYRKLAAKIDYRMFEKGGKVIAVTSVAENEGKSTVAANLAISLAQESKRTLLIDGDLRRPAQFLIFGAKTSDENEFGELLKGRAELSDVLLSSYVQNLFLMVGRNCYSSSMDMLQSQSFKKLMEACRKSFDYIVIDSPPAELMGGAEVIASVSDGVVIVARQNYISAEDINDTIDEFRDNHADVLGVLLNKVQTISDTMNLSAPRYGGYSDYGNYSDSHRKH